MIYPKHNRWYKLFFDLYTSYIIKSDFKFIEIRKEGAIEFSSQPLLVLANHYSWWDGFFHYHLNNLFYRKIYHVMMLEEQLQKRMFLTRLGIFSVRKGTRDAIRSLQFATEILKSPGNMLLLFPQGKIESHHQQQFIFEAGANKIIESNSAISVLFCVSLVDYFSDRKPVASFYFKKYDGPLNLEGSYNQFYQQCLEKQKSKG